MENYCEQTVIRAQSGRNRALYALAWMAIIFMMLSAVIFGASILGTAENGSLSFSWLSAIICIAMLALSFIIFRAKDRLNLEYDYLLQDDSFSVTAVMNNRRRKTVLSLQLGRIQECGIHDGRQFSGTVDKFYLEADARLTYICFEDKGSRRTALVQLNEDMIAQLCGSRALQRGVWRDGKGRTEQNASLS